MTQQLVPNFRNSHALVTKQSVPAIISFDGQNAMRRYLEFFTAKIRNRGTRHVYAHAVLDFFSWCEAQDISLHFSTAVNSRGYSCWRSTPPEFSGHCLSNNPEPSAHGPTSWISAAVLSCCWRYPRTPGPTIKPFSWAR